MVEFWRAGGPGDLDPASAARAVEAAGWDGQMFMDSQSLSADPYVLMAQWAAATERIRLSTGVTNTLTRHPAVTATSIATIQAVSGGRAVLGIGRGDSALAYLGLAPVPVAAFERALADLQALLRGEEIGFAPHPLATGARDGDTLELGSRPQGTRLSWLPTGLPKVPMDVAATGPRVIALGARIAERVTFSVGADPDRLDWAITVAERARIGSAAPPVSFGAQVVVACHRRPDEVIEAAARMVLPLARFQVIQAGAPAGPVRDGDAAEYEAIRRGYAMTRHSDFEADKLVSGTVDPEFVRRFAIVGSPDECIRRLIDLVGRGIERFVVFGPGYHDDGADGTLFASEVLPAVRESVASQNQLMI